MVRPIDTRQLKTDAFSLSKALAAHHIKLSHQQCLDVLAKVYGSKSFEALSAQSETSETESFSGSFDEAAARLFNAMRCRVESWGDTQGKHSMVMHETLMGGARVVGRGIRQDLDEMSKKSRELDGSGWISAVFDDFNVQVRISGVRGSWDAISDRGTWRRFHVEVLVRAEDLSSQRRMDELALRIYRDYLSKVELVARGYVECRETFQRDVQVLKKEGRSLDVMWTFLEEESWNFGEDVGHPMVVCGEHIIFASRVKVEDYADGRVHMTVALWHREAAQVLYANPEDAISADPSKVLRKIDAFLSEREPMVLDIREIGGERFEWNHKVKFLNSLDAKQDLKRVLEAVQLATDGAVLMSARRGRVEVQVDGAEIVDGWIEVLESEDYFMDRARVELSEATTRALLTRLGWPIEKGMIRVAHVRGGSRGQAEKEWLNVDYAMLNGSAIQMVLWREL